MTLAKTMPWEFMRDDNPRTFTFADRVDIVDRHELTLPRPPGINNWIDNLRKGFIPAAPHERVFYNIEDPEAQQGQMNMPLDPAMADIVLTEGEKAIALRKALKLKLDLGGKGELTQIEKMNALLTARKNKAAAAALPAPAAGPVHGPAPAVYPDPQYIIPEMVPAQINLGPGVAPMAPPGPPGPPPPPPPAPGVAGPPDLLAGGPAHLPRAPMAQFVPVRIEEGPREYIPDWPPPPGRLVPAFDEIGGADDYKVPFIPNFRFHTDDPEHLIEDIAAREQRWQNFVNKQVPPAITQYKNRKMMDKLIIVGTNIDKGSITWGLESAYDREAYLNRTRHIRRKDPNKKIDKVRLRWARDRFNQPIEELDEFERAEAREKSPSLPPQYPDPMNDPGFLFIDSPIKAGSVPPLDVVQGLSLSRRQIEEEMKKLAKQVEEIHLGPFHMDDLPLTPPRMPTGSIPADAGLPYDPMTAALEAAEERERLRAKQDVPVPNLQDMFNAAAAEAEERNAEKERIARLLRLQEQFNQEIREEKQSEIDQDILDDETFQQYQKDLDEAWLDEMVEKGKDEQQKQERIEQEFAKMVSEDQVKQRDKAFKKMQTEEARIKRLNKEEAARIEARKRPIEHIESKVALDSYRLNYELELEGIDDPRSIEADLVRIRLDPGQKRLEMINRHPKLLLYANALREGKQLEAAQWKSMLLDEHRQFKLDRQSSDEVDTIMRERQVVFNHETDERKGRAAIMNLQSPIRLPYTQMTNDSNLSTVQRQRHPSSKLQLDITKRIWDGLFVAGNIKDPLQSAADGASVIIHNIQPEFEPNYDDTLQRQIRQLQRDNPLVPPLELFKIDPMPTVKEFKENVANDALIIGIGARMDDTNLYLKRIKEDMDENSRIRLDPVQMERDIRDRNHPRPEVPPLEPFTEQKQPRPSPQPFTEQKEAGPGFSPPEMQQSFVGPEGSWYDRPIIPQTIKQTGTNLEFELLAQAARPTTAAIDPSSRRRTRARRRQMTPKHIMESLDEIAEGLVDDEQKLFDENQIKKAAAAQRAKLRPRKKTEPPKPPRMPMGRISRVNRPGWQDRARQSQEKPKKLTVRQKADREKRRRKRLKKAREKAYLEQYFDPNL